MTYTKYEYRQEISKNKDISLEFLNLLGDDGWKLVHIERVLAKPSDDPLVSLLVMYVFVRVKEVFIDPDEILGVGSAGDPI